MNPSFAEKCIRIQSSLKPGTIIRNWTALKGYLGDTMTVVQIDQDQVVIDAPNAKNLQHVSRNEFEEIWNVWPKYLSIQMQRQEIRALTFHSKYILSILHWLEDNQF